MTWETSTCLVLDGGVGRGDEGLMGADQGLVLCVFHSYRHAHTQAHDTDLDHDVGDVEGGDVGEEVAELHQGALGVLQDGVVRVEGAREEEDCVWSVGVIWSGKGPIGFC